MQRTSTSNIFRILIWFIFLLGGIWGGIRLDLRWFRGAFFNPFFHLGTLIAGVLLLRLVMRISRNTGRVLARYGREGDLPRMETNRLVTRGVYGCMRHPMHLGLLFFPLAIALIVGSPGFILLIWPAEALLMLAMIKGIEEKEALAKFGDAYRQYQQQVSFFNLRLSCLKLLLLGEEEDGKEGGSLHGERRF